MKTPENSTFLTPWYTRDGLRINGQKMLGFLRFSGESKGNIGIVTNENAWYERLMKHSGKMVSRVYPVGKVDNKDTRVMTMKSF